MKSFNGHRSWNAWNVYAWLNNEEWSYELMRWCIKNSRDRKEAARMVIDRLPSGSTPDGAKFNLRCVMDAMRGIDE